MKKIILLPFLTMLLTSMAAINAKKIRIDTNIPEDETSWYAEKFNLVIAENSNDLNRWEKTVDLPNKITGATVEIPDDIYYNNNKLRVKVVKKHWKYPEDVVKKMIPQGYDIFISAAKPTFTIQENEETLFE